MSNNSDSDNKDAESNDDIGDFGIFFDGLLHIGYEMYVFKNILCCLSINDLKITAALNWVIRDTVICHIKNIGHVNPNELSTTDLYYYLYEAMTLFGGDDDDDDIDIDCQNLQKQQIIKCIIQSRVIDTIIVIGDNYDQIIFRIIDEESINAYVNHVKQLSKPSNKNEFKLLIKNHLNRSIQFINGKVKCNFCKQHFQEAKRQIGKITALFNPEKKYKNGVKYKCGNLWTHVTISHLNVFKAVYMRKIKLKSKSTARLLESKSISNANAPEIEQKTQNNISENDTDPPDESNQQLCGLFNMISIRKNDEYLSVYDNVQSIKIFLLNIQISSKAVEFIISPNIDIVSDWFINPYKQMIRCTDCTIVCNDAQKLQEILPMITHKCRNHIPNGPYIVGRTIIGLTKTLLEGHCGTEIHLQCHHLQRFGIPNVPHSSVSAQITNAATDTEYRFGTILWMMIHKLPPHLIASIHELLTYHQAPHRGLTGLSDTVALKMTQVTGLYTLAVMIKYINENVRCLCIGLDCAQTNDQIKLAHFNFRFVVSAYPITIHIGTRKIGALCTGESLLKVTKNVIEFSDLHDAEFIGFSIGKQYKYYYDGKEQIRQLINVIECLKRAGLCISLRWNKFIVLLIATINDGGGDVWGCHKGWSALLSEEKKKLCGVQTERIRCVCHIIDIFAQKTFEEQQLFYFVLDPTCVIRSFVNKSGGRKYILGTCVLWNKSDFSKLFQNYPDYFEDRWIVNIQEATRAWRNNYRGLHCFLVEMKQEITAKIAKNDAKKRAIDKINELKDYVVGIGDHIRSYATHSVMTMLSSKWVSMSESQCLNVNTYVNYVEACETSICIACNDKSPKWESDFKRDNIKQVQNQLKWVKYIKQVKDRNNKKSMIEVAETMSKQKYGKERNEILKEFREACLALKKAIQDHKKTPQFKLFVRLKYVTDYNDWNLCTSDVNVVINYLKNRNKSPLKSLYTTFRKKLIAIGMDDTKDIDTFLFEITEAQVLCAKYIFSLCIDNTQKLSDVIKCKEHDFYNIWKPTYVQYNSKHAFTLVYDYAMTINVQNVFSEQQGKNTNLVRNNLQHRSTPNTVNMKLFGVFNVPKQILLIEFHSHVMALSHIWKNVLRCHDVINVSNKNMIQQQMEMDRFAPKLPKVTCKSYSRRKRAIDKQNAIKEIWNKTTTNVLSLARRALLKRGKSDNSDSS